MDQDYDNIAGALRYELEANQGSVDGTVAVHRCINHLGLVLSKMDPKFDIETFLTACGVQS